MGELLIDIPLMRHHAYPTKKSRKKRRKTNEKRKRENGNGNGEIAEKQYDGIFKNNKIGTVRIIRRKKNPESEWGEMV